MTTIIHRKQGSHSSLDLHDQKGAGQNVEGRGERGGERSDTEDIGTTGVNIPDTKDHKRCYGNGTPCETSVILILSTLCARE